MNNQIKDALNRPGLTLKIIISVAAAIILTYSYPHTEATRYNYED